MAGNSRRDGEKIKKSVSINKQRDTQTIGGRKPIVLFKAHSKSSDVPAWGDSTPSGEIP